MMPPWADELLKVYKERVTEIAQMSVASLHRDAGVAGKYNVPDIEQMLNGIIAMMAEQLAGGQNDIYETYMQTVIPGILAQGERLSVFVRHTIYAAGASLRCIVIRVSPQHQEAVGEFVTNWWADHIADIVALGVREDANA